MLHKVVLTSMVFRETFVLALLEEKKTSQIFMTEDCFANWSTMPTESRLFPPTGIGRQELLPPLMFAFQKDGSQVCEETCLSFGTGERLI